MGCLKLTYQNFESPLKVVYKKSSFEQNNVQRFLRQDPLAESYYSYTPYNYVMNNPMNMIDPDGRFALSTHIDEKGTVISEYDDGDDGVYVHSNETTEEQVSQQREDNKNTGGDGEHIGEIGGVLDVNEVYTNTLKENTSEAKSLHNPLTFKVNVKTGGKWDLKNNKETIYGVANDGKTKFSFKGNLMESQDIGNHHFGAVGKAYGYFTESFMLKQAGAYQIKSGTSKSEWQRYKIVKVAGSRRDGIPASTKRIMLPPYGDDPRDQSWIKAGFNYYKANK